MPESFRTHVRISGTDGEFCNLPGFKIPCRYNFAKVFRYITGAGSVETMGRVTIHVISSKGKRIHTEVHRNQIIGPILETGDGYEIIKISFRIVGPVLISDSVRDRYGSVLEHTQGRDSKTPATSLMLEEPKHTKNKEGKGDGERGEKGGHKQKRDNGSFSSEVETTRVTIRSEEGKVSERYWFENFDFTVSDLKNLLCSSAIGVEQAEIHVAQQGNTVVKSLGANDSVGDFVGKGKTIEEIAITIEEGRPLPKMPRYFGKLDVNDPPAVFNELNSPDSTVSLFSPSRTMSPGLNTGRSPFFSSDDSQFSPAFGGGKQRDGKSININEEKCKWIVKGGITKEMKEVIVKSNPPEVSVGKSTDVVYGESEYVEVDFDVQKPILFEGGSGVSDSLFQLMLPMYKVIEGLTGIVRVTSGSKSAKVTVHRMFDILTKMMKRGEDAPVNTMGFVEAAKKLFINMSFYDVATTTFSILGMMASKVPTGDQTLIKTNEVVYRKSIRYTQTSTLSTMNIIVDTALVEVKFLCVRKNEILSGVINVPAEIRFKHMCLLVLSKMKLPLGIMLVAYQTRGVLVSQGANIVMGVNKPIGNIPAFQIRYEDKPCGFEGGNEFIFYECDLDPSSSSTRVYPFMYVKSDPNSNNIVYPTNVSFPVLVVENSGRFDARNFARFNKTIGVTTQDLRPGSSCDPSHYNGKAVTWGWSSAKDCTKIGEMVNILKVDDTKNFGGITKVRCVTGVKDPAGSFGCNKFYENAFRSWFVERCGKSEYKIRDVKEKTGSHVLPPYLLVLIAHKNPELVKPTENTLPNRLDFKDCTGTDCFYVLRGVVDNVEGGFSTYVKVMTDYTVFRYSTKKYGPRQCNGNVSFVKPIAALYVRE